VRALLAAAGLVLTAGTTSRAQQADTVACAGQRIEDVVIYTAAPTAAVLRRVPVLAKVVAAVHTTTHPDIVRRFLLLKPGDTCDELRRAESERILRAQPFIAEASVRAVPENDGGVRLVVQTTDEVALVLGLAAAAANPPVRFFRLGDGNLSGRGVYLAGDWRYGGPFRNGYGGQFVDNQFLGHPYVLDVDGHVYPLGSDWNVGASHPFYTDIQRIAWRARLGAEDNYVEYRNNDTSSHALWVARNYFDIGGIIRVGPPGRLSLFGASISGDDERPGDRPVLITDDGFAPDSSTLLVNRFSDHRIARVNALWGVRDIGFAQVTGFDALTGRQDLAVGFQLGTLFGRSLSVLGARDDDIFMSGDLYIGQAGHNNALRVQAQTEARRDNTAGEWDGILAAANAIEYFKFVPSQTTTLSLEFSGGWNVRVPFNLTLGDPSGGLRGFAGSNIPGGQRFVARLDNRLFVGRPFNLADLGVAAFYDTGRLWAGDIPYGVTTPLYSSLGVSLLGAAPIRSARIWRLDLAYAIRPEPGGHRWELRVSSRDRTTFFLAEPNDIGNTRERTVPSSVFRWPQ
jgi:hypothetical protein